MGGFFGNDDGDDYGYENYSYAEPASYDMAADSGYQDYAYK